MKIYDLSCTIEKELWHYGKPYIPYESVQLANVHTNGFITNKQVMTSHTGTHIEGGRHWWEDSDGIEKTPLDKVVGKAKILRFECNEMPFFEISKEKIIKAGGENLQEGDICILVTGWDKRIKEQNYTWESPFITVEAAEYLVEKKVKLIAIDAPMIGDPRDGMECVPAELMLPDYVMLRNNVFCIVGLVNAENLPDEVFFIGAPLKIKDADGSPIRAMAIEF